MENKTSVPSQARQKISITRVIVQDLFGSYSYSFPEVEFKGESIILYAENGSGKTNILRIIFHLLSPMGNRGHRNALGRIKFSNAEIQLSNGISVSAVRPGGSTSAILRMEVNKLKGKKRELLGAWTWAPKDTPESDLLHRAFEIEPSIRRSFHELRSSKSEKEKASLVQQFMLNYFERETDPRETEEAFLNALRENVPPIYFLTSDRILSSDTLRRMEDLRDHDRKGYQRESDALREALQTTSRALSRLAVRAARHGSQSSHNIYLDLIRRLAKRRNRPKKTSANTLSEIAEKVKSESENYKRYAKYGLTPDINGEEIVNLLNQMTPEEHKFALEVLTPYIESLSTQSESIESPYQIIDIFVSTVNKFLFDKQAKFTLGEGISILNMKGEPLDPQELSSGEKQLFMLFCHITTAKDSGGIFIIDEPEISLNIRWQRSLVSALNGLD
jgi:energy-coupling factor transporter ATP-binding protein EcfA2